jgi:uncharacterized coiled-coil protein SlyX
MMEDEHGARVECAERLAAIETRLTILDEVRREVGAMDSRLVRVEGWVKTQNGTLQTVRDQVVAILRALDVFQEHSAAFERDMKDYRVKREEHEREEEKHREEQMRAELARLQREDGGDKPEPGKAGVVRLVLREKAAWVLIGIIVGLALLLAVAMGLEWWKARAERYIDTRIPAATATSTPGPTGVH